MLLMKCNLAITIPANKTGLSHKYKNNKLIKHSMANSHAVRGLVDYGHACMV